LLVLLGLELGVPLFAVEVVDLVCREAIAVLEVPAVIGREGAVNTTAEEHRPGRRWLLALDIAPPPRPEFCAPRARVLAFLTGRDERQTSAARPDRVRRAGRGDAPTKYEKYE
jgi:hypothetical protein